MKSIALYEVGMQLANIFRNEHILIDSLSIETFIERFTFTAKVSEITFDKEKQEI